LFRRIATAGIIAAGGEEQRARDYRAPEGACYGILEIHIHLNNMISFPTM
jgi:hypothetical protein